MIIIGKKVSRLIGVVVFVIIISILYWLFYSKKMQEFYTFNQIIEYSKTLPEKPESDSDSWQDPDFDSFYKQRAPSAISEVFRKFGLARHEPWSAEYLIMLLDQVYNLNLNFGLHETKENFIHLKSDSKTKIYVFSDVQGGFHNLISQLEFLRKSGDMSDDLKITNEQTYMVFIGNVVGRFSYNIDTLILLMNLIKNNPKNVFYLAGKQERDSYWLDFCLKDELVYRARTTSFGYVPYREKIDKFLSTLPEAIYVSTSASKKDLIRLSHNARNELSFVETNLSGDFLNQRERVLAHIFKPKLIDEQAIDTRAAIRTEDWMLLYQINHGFRLVGQDQGATTWVVESPEACAVIKIGDYITDSTITSILRSDNDQQFIEQESFNLVLGKTAPYKNEIRSIKIASTMSLVRGVPTLGQQAKIGLDLGIKTFNTNKNNQQFLIRSYINNDDYQPLLARYHTQNYLNWEVPFLVLPTGTPTTRAAMELIATSGKNVIVVFPISGATELRQPQLKNLINFRASYEDEVRVLMNEMLTERGSNKFAFFYQDDSFGRPIFYSAIEHLKRAGINEYLGIPYTRGSVYFDKQINAIDSYRPDALGLFSTSLAADEFISQIGINKIENTQLFAISFASSVGLRRFAKERGLEITFGAVVPNPQVSSTKIAQEYRKDIDSVNEVYDTFSFESYIASKIFVNAIQRLGRRDPSPSNVMNSLESIKHVDFEGIKLNFDPKTRSLSQYVWIETGQNNIWKQFPAH